MKKLADLSAVDLEAHCVWKYHPGPTGTDSGAEVEPSDRTSLSESEDDAHIAATRFTLKDGSRWMGYCSPEDSSGLDYVQPVILTESGPNPLWFETAPSSADQAEWWRRIGRSQNEVFPITWECLVPVDGTVVRGVVDGFDVGVP